MRQIALLPNVACKISGVLAYCKPGHATTEAVRPYVEHSLECFGWDRVVWGGDWPVCTLTSTLRQWVATSLENRQQRCQGRPAQALPRKRGSHLRPQVSPVNIPYKVELPQHPRPICVIGAGGIVNDAHLPAYRLAGFEVASILDLQRERAESLAVKYGIPKAYTKIEKRSRQPYGLGQVRMGEYKFTSWAIINAVLVFFWCDGGPFDAGMGKAAVLAPGLRFWPPSLCCWLPSD